MLAAIWGHAQVTTPSNSPFSGDYVGCDGGTTFPLEVRHNGNYPIQWYTDSLQRMQLYPNVSPVINGYPALPRNGSLVLSNLDAGFAPARVPFSRLHLIDVGGNTNANFIAAEVGFRSWMRNGVTFTGNSDQSYIGAKYGVNESGAQLADATDMVLQWSNDVPGEYGPDRLRFLYTADRVVGSTHGSNSEEGLEAMRFTPIDNATINAGLGDFHRGNILDPVNVNEPTERLDILNGKVRIRQLPSDPVSASTEYVTVNTLTGVLEHRPLTNLPDNCEWTMNPSGADHVYTAFGPATSGCPDEDEAVGVGMDLSSATPPGKLSLYTAQFDRGVDVEVARTATELRGMNVYAVGATDYNYGLYAEVKGAARTRGVYGESSNAGYFGIGGLFVSRDESDYAVGAQGHVVAGNKEAFGVWGTCVSDGKLNVGVRGQNNSTNTYGTHYIGVQGVSTVTPSAAQRSIGVHGQAPVATDSWGVYCDGKQYSSAGGTLWTIPSDQTLKTDIEPLEGALEQIIQLQPKRYRYRTEEFPYAQLAQGEQYGLLAQELETVFPHMVSDAYWPAVVDSTGAELQAARTVKVVNLSDMIPLLIAGMIEQEAMVSSQVAAMEELRAQMAEMQTALAACCANPDGGRMLDQGSTRPTELEGSGPGNEMLRIQPNPFNERTTVYYTLERGGRTQLIANSADGKELRVLQEANLEAGSYQFEWDTADLAPGLYYVTLLRDGQPVVKKAVKVGR